VYPPKTFFLLFRFSKLGLRRRDSLFDFWRLSKNIWKVVSEVGALKKWCCVDVVTFAAVVVVAAASREFVLAF